MAFAWSRNPVYVAMTALYWPLALEIGSVWPLLAWLPLWLLMHYGVIRREEHIYCAVLAKPMPRLSATYPPLVCKSPLASLHGWPNCCSQTACQPPSLRI